MFQVNYIRLKQKGNREIGLYGKRILFLILAVCTLSAVAREQIPLTSWKFHFGDVPGAVQIGFDDSGWKRVRVPHDWAIDQPFDMRIDMQSIQVLEDGDKAPKMRTGRTGLCRHSESDIIVRKLFPKLR